MLKWVKTGETTTTSSTSLMMENNIQTIELSMGKLELCPKAVLAIWPYGATKVSKSSVIASTWGESGNLIFNGRK